MGLKIFLNGDFVDKGEAVISVFDHGVLYGDGVFEGIRSYDRRVFRLDKHLDRLYDGAKMIRLKIPMTKDDMKKKIIETLKINNLDNAYIRVVVTRGPGDLGLDPRKCSKPTIFIITDKITLYPSEYYEVGLPIIIAKTRRNHPLSMDPRIKSLNYLNNIMAKSEAIDAGTEEALMLTVEGAVAECTGDNIFIVRDKGISTPPSSVGALKGITQSEVVEIAKKNGIGVVFKNISKDDLFAADECFLTGTAAEVIPVVKIDGKMIGKGKPGDITRKLIQEFREVVKSDGNSY